MVETGEEGGVPEPSLSASLGRLFYKGEDRLFLEGFSFPPDTTSIFLPPQALCDLPPSVSSPHPRLWSHIEQLRPGSSISSIAGTRRCSPVVGGKAHGNGCRGVTWFCF